ncbi:MAG TPA: DUF2059 domain-containing protein [Verrucomicrobiae bacterium]|nr:DUF2059 domain-containing protein [Verrucomicrobiae bacterium]
MRKVLLLLVLVVACAPVFAQTVIGGKIANQAKTAEETFSPDAPTHDQVMTLLDLLQIRKTMAVMMDGMKKAMKQGAEQTFRERVPDPTPQQLEALHGIIDDIVGDMPVDDLLEAVVPIYRRHLTKSDVDEMIRFFAGPVGQKLLREQPQMMQEGMQAGMAIQEKRMDQVMIKVKERTQKLVEASEEKNSTPKK